MKEYHYRYETADGGPLRKCPACRGILTEERGIELVLSVSDHVFSVWTRLDNHGNLLDTVDGAVVGGFHSTTCCGHCGKQLIDMDDVREIENGEEYYKEGRYV
jgi:hypothetical protein